MPSLNFKEISKANTGMGKQDEFELFAREFFVEVMHFEIVSEPNRGADGGKDLIAIEKQVGKLSNNEIKWLISCKHNAHSGKAVNESDEQNISDRVKQHKANGFISFYSTLPSSGLSNRLDSFKDIFKVEIFNHERIETELLKSKRNCLIERFFPESYKKAVEKKDKNTPSILFGQYEPLCCEYCGKDLLKEHLHDNGAVVTFIVDMKSHLYKDIYTSCKGHCDQALLLVKRHKGEVDEWEDISDWVIPSIFIKKQMAIFNELYNQNIKFTKDAFEKLKHFILKLSQFSLRAEDDEQMGRVRDLAVLPEWI